MSATKPLSPQTEPSSLSVVARFAVAPRGSQVILTRQEGRCLRYVAEHPGSSSTQVQHGVGIRHRSQVSRVLGRLQKEGLALTVRDGGSLNAWTVTRVGTGVLGELPEGMYV